MYCDGGIQISEMIHHLVQQHGHKKIAFVESWTRDNRIDYYTQTLRDYQLFDGDLIVSTYDLEDIAIPERAGIGLLKFWSKEM